jgi:signal transduction histidine kinase
MLTITIIVLVVLCIYLLQQMIRSRTLEKSLLSIINHTFRTPLTSIKWMSDSLNTEFSIEKQHEAGRNIAISAERLLETIDIIAGVKDIRDRSSYDLKAVSIREIIEQAMSKYREPLNAKRITFNLPTFTNMPLLTLDTKKISFVIDALLQNAIFYTKENGHITVASTVNKYMVTITIKDDGIGLSWIDKINLYRRFYRGKIAKKMNTDGVGLSLYLTKIIIERHRGSIRASSWGRNHGSMLAITLPISR